MVHVVEQANFSEPVRGVPVAKRAYVFYHDGSDYCSVTQHEVREGSLGPGRVVSLKGVGERFARMTRSDAPCLLPDNVFVSNGRMFAWVTTSRHAPMWFSINGRQWAHRVDWPHLLWIAYKDRPRLRVFALGRASRPRLDTVVYHAPLMNIGSDGSLCEGTARLPRRMDESRLADIESCIYDSNFTHVNHDKTLKGRPGNREHIAYWGDQEKLAASVKVADLVRRGTLAEVLQ
jgi:PRTRC genetic system protein B